MMRFVLHLSASLLLLTPLDASASHYPVHLHSARDIAHAPANTNDIQIAGLPLDAYPALARFHKLEGARFYSPAGTGADDERMSALSRVGFAKLFDITLLNCPKVTDRGIAALVQLPSLRYLQLEGTSISDAGCAMLAAKRSVCGVNVSNCKKVTLKGIMALAHSETMNHLVFSAQGLTQDEVLRVIRVLPHAEWCEILDPKGVVDAGRAERLGKSRGIHVNIWTEGALQEMKRTDLWEFRLIPK